MHITTHHPHPPSAVSPWCLTLNHLTDEILPGGQKEVSYDKTEVTPFTVPQLAGRVEGERGRDDSSLVIPSSSSSAGLTCKYGVT